MVDAMPLRVRALTMVDATSSARDELCSVLLMNDGFNMREYVARVLMMVCELSESEADRVMMQAHREYSAVVGTWERPVAQHICDGMKQAGLHAAIEAESAIQTETQDPDEAS
jgi:ATP-dependent Clp protease adapter protein ClpS